MKNKLIVLFKNSREKFYKSLNRPRLYYNDNPYLKNYKLKKTNLAIYKKNSFTNKDMFEILKSKLKS